MYHTRESSANNGTSTWPYHTTAPNCQERFPIWGSLEIPIFAWFPYIVLQVVCIHLGNPSIVTLRLSWYLGPPHCPLAPLSCGIPSSCSFFLLPSLKLGCAPSNQSLPSSWAKGNRTSCFPLWSLCSLVHKALSPILRKQRLDFHAYQFLRRADQYVAKIRRVFYNCILLVHIVYGLEDPKTLPPKLDFSIWRHHFCSVLSDENLAFQVFKWRNCGLILSWFRLQA